MPKTPSMQVQQRAHNKFMRDQQELTRTAESEFRNMWLAASAVLYKLESMPEKESRRAARQSLKMPVRLGGYTDAYNSIYSATPLFDTLEALSVLRSKLTGQPSITDLMKKEN